MGEGLTGWLWEKKAQLRLLNASDEAELKSIDPSGALRVRTKSAEKHNESVLNPRSFLGGVICVGQTETTSLQIRGLIRLIKEASSIPFLPYDEQLLDLICSVLAPAIERWNTTTELHHQVAVHESLRAIIDAVYAPETPDTKSVCDVITNAALDLFDAYTSSLLLKLPNEDKLRVESDVGYHEKLPEDIVVPFDRGICGYAARHKESVVVPDVRADARYFGILPEVKSEICAPIIANGECIGVINLDSDHEGHFREDDRRTLDLLNIFAKQAALALSRAMLLSERDQWHKQIVHTTQMLTATTIASGLAHELKNGLLQISTLAQRLEPDPAIKMRAENRQRLADIRDVSGKLSSLAIRLGDLSRIGHPVKQAAYLNDVILERAHILEEFLNTKDLKLVLRLDPTLSKPAAGAGHRVMADPSQIQQVLTNLVLNAADVSHPMQPIEVITKNESDAWVSFSVRDFGMGISDENKEHIFDMFFTTKPRGFGIGLPVVKLLVQENHGGAINFQTKLGKGTTFHILLPKAAKEEPLT
jgi:signal transduction histidine kinase